MLTISPCSTLVRAFSSRKNLADEVTGPVPLLHTVSMSAWTGTTSLGTGGTGGVGCMLHVQVLHIQRVLFDEFPPVFHVLAHQRAEDLFAFYRVFQPDL